MKIWPQGREMFKILRKQIKNKCPFRLNLPRCCAVKYCCSTKKAISVSTSHMVFSWRITAPFQVREPPAGPKKIRYLSPEGTFQKNWSISPTLIPFNLLLQNFPGPLAFRITIYKVLTPSGQLFIKIWPQGREIFRILWNILWKIRMPFSLQFAPLSCYKVLLFDKESNLRLH